MTSKPMKRWPRLGLLASPALLANIALATMVACAACAVAILAEPFVGKPSAALAAVLGVALAGANLGLIPALAAAFTTFLLYNFFLAVPPLSFRFSTPRDVAPLAAFCLAAVLTGVLAGRLKDREQRTRRASRRLATLLDTSRALLAAVTHEEIALAVRQSAADDPLVTDLLSKVDRTPILSVEPKPAERSARSGSVDRAPTIERDFRLALAALIALAEERARLSARILDTELLARSEQFKSLLLSSVSHDLRTPMAAIIASASSLHDFADVLSDNSKARLLQTIINEADRLDRFTANLLELSRLQSAAPLPTQCIDPAGVMNSAMARLHLPAGRHVSGRIPADLYTLRVNHQLFQVVLTNILENAAVHASDGDIEVEAMADRSNFQLSISDHGEGIPHDERGRIFERFHRLNFERPGSGLGLAIAKGFVEASAGSIMVADRVDGQPGTRIVVTLPMVREDELRDE